MTSVQQLSSNSLSNGESSVVPQADPIPRQTSPRRRNSPGTNFDDSQAGFNRVVVAQLQSLEDQLVHEKEKSIELLRSELQRIRDELLQFDDEGSPPATAKVTHFSEETVTVLDIDEYAWEQQVQASLVMQEDDTSPNADEPDLDDKDASGLKAVLRKSMHNERTQRLYHSTSKRTRAKVVTHFGGHMPSAPHEWTTLQRVVFSSTFEIVCGAIILANTVILALQLQYYGFDAGHELKFPGIDKDAKNTWPGADKVFTGFNIVFNLSFAIELLLRIGANKWRSPLSGWIWFDALIVLTGLVDTLGWLTFNPTILRCARLLRLVRLLKVFQAMSAFDSLFLLLKAFHASQQALVWSFLVLGLVQIVVGLSLCQLLQDFYYDNDVLVDDRRKVFEYFGTFSRTVLTMYEITMGNWVPSCRALHDHASQWFILFYIAYRCMFCFAMLKVIAAVFITETNRVLESDDELTVMKHDRAESNFKHKLARILRAIDPHNKSGKFGWHQLDRIITSQEVSHLITSLHFEIHDFEKLFWLLDDGSGEISVDEFVNKMSKLKGLSKTIDMLSMLKLGHRISQNVEKIAQLVRVATKNDLQDEEEMLACRI
mmetsp:Transcript_81401/g.141001  ORF Transcript_81401/g.141001 Transcript_81401/m.141001 type:complete len:600 (+) Transcript_81401:71-1870(+)